MVPGLTFHYVLGRFVNQAQQWQQVVEMIQGRGVELCLKLK